MNVPLCPEAVLIPFDHPACDHEYAPGVISLDAGGRATLQIGWDLDRDGRPDIHLCGEQRAG